MSMMLQMAFKRWIPQLYSVAMAPRQSGHLLEIIKLFSMHSRQKMWLHSVIAGRRMIDLHTEQINSSSFFLMNCANSKQRRDVLASISSILNLSVYSSSLPCSFFPASVSYLLSSYYCASSYLLFLVNFARTIALTSLLLICFPA